MNSEIGERKLVQEASAKTQEEVYVCLEAFPLQGVPAHIEQGNPCLVGRIPEGERVG